MSIVFAAHTCFRAGAQALEFLSARYDWPVRPLSGNDPCPPTEGRVLVRGSSDWPYPGPYAPYFYLQKIGVAPIDADILWDDRLHWLIKNMSWVMRAGEVVFINPRYLNGIGAFEAEHLIGFERQLHNLVQPALTN